MVRHESLFHRPLSCSAMQGGATAARQECVHGANLSSALACLATYLCGRPAHTAAEVHCVDTDRQGERGIGRGRCMAERRGRERKSGPVLAHARPAHEGGRKEGREAEWEENIPLLLSFFLFFLPSSFLGRAIGLAVARSVAAAAANASGSVM